METFVIVQVVLTIVFILAIYALYRYSCNIQQENRAIYKFLEQHIKDYNRSMDTVFIGFDACNQIFDKQIKKNKDVEERLTKLEQQ